jgi:DNA-binding Xre family transcriptional regulator
MDTTRHQPLTLAGRRYVVVPERDYERMREALDDAADLADVRRFEERRAAGERPIPLEMTKRMVAGESPIRVWREHRGLSAAQLAERAGLSRGYVSQLETGEREGTISTIAALATALEVEVADLIATREPHAAEAR